MRWRVGTWFARNFKLCSDEFEARIMLNGWSIHQIMTHALILLDDVREFCLEPNLLVQGHLDFDRSLSVYNKN